LVKRIYKGRFLNEMLERSKNIKKTVAFSDGNDIRLIKALDFFTSFNDSKYILVGNETEILDKIREVGIKKLDNFSIMDPKKSQKQEEYKQTIKSLYEIRKKSLTGEELSNLVLDTSFYTALLLKTNEADCALGGSISTTEALTRAVIYVLGLAKGKKFLCAASFVDVPDCIYGAKGKFCMADTAIIPKPTEEQMIEIVLSTYETAKPVLGQEPLIAMLSYSTKGSAKSEEIDKIKKVVEKVKQIRPGIKIDGELQFDAAIVPEVAKIKLSESEVAGYANVLIFPDLNSANIGFKIIHRLAKAEVYTTVIQGAAKTFNDLSRGCNVEDIISMIALTLLQNSD
jgi:phosphate acetyltransferase